MEEGSGGVLGANAMMGHDVFFDVDNGQIGWAESSCDYTALMKKHYPSFISDEPGTARVEPAKSDNDDDDIEMNEDGEHSDSDDDLLLPGSDFCSSTGCQAGFVAVVVAGVVFGAMRMLRKTDVEYELTSTSGLELQSSKPDKSSDFGYHDNGGGFKDDDKLSPHELS